MDGNFKLAPVNLEFQQLYIIRGGIADTAAILVYCLMERLDQAAYQELLNILVHWEFKLRRLGVTVGVALPNI